MLFLGSAAFSQCFNVLQPTLISLQSDGRYRLTITYNTTGSKALDVLIKCGNTVLVSECFIDNCSPVAPATNCTKIYSDLLCPSGNISAILTPHTGNCNAKTCPPVGPIYGPAGAPTPVRLTSFSAVRTKQIVSISWNTEFEIDAKEFIVERAEGTEFRSVGTISTNGNSSIRKSYSFNDKNENAGSTYYRLQNVDLNGSFTYSEIRTVKGFGIVNDVTVFPNPAHSNSKVSLVGVTANSSIQLLDFSGKILKTVNSTSNNSFDLTGVKNGTYLIRIVDKITNEIVNKTLTVNN